MPVVVTGVDRPLGRAVVLALVADEGVEVRATVRNRAAVGSLVARGVRTAVSDLADPRRLGAVLTGAHTVLHLDGDDPLATWGWLLEAAEDTGVARLVTVCRPDQDPPAAPYPTVVIRAATREPTQALVAALLEADRRRDAEPLRVVDLPDLLGLDR